MSADDGLVQRHGLQVSLEPPGPLAHEAPEVRDALLVDGRLPAEFIDPPAGVEPDSKVEVFGERLRPRVRSEGVERGKPDELAVSAHSDAPEVAPPPLEDLDEDDELHVLHPRQERAPAVVDPHAHLDRAHLRVGEGNPGLGDGMGVEPPVGVDDADDDVVRRTRDIALTHEVERGVEGFALAQASVGQDAPHDGDSRIADALDQIGGAVFRAVVDDEDVDIRSRGSQKGFDAGDDDLGLVQARYENDHPRPGELRRALGGFGRFEHRPPARRALARGGARKHEEDEPVDDRHEDHEERAPPADCVEHFHEARRCGGHSNSSAVAPSAKCRPRGAWGRFTDDAPLTRARKSEKRKMRDNAMNTNPARSTNRRASNRGSDPVGSPLPRTSSPVPEAKGR